MLFRSRQNTKQMTRRNTWCGAVRMLTAEVGRAVLSFHELNQLSLRTRNGEQRLGHGKHEQRNEREREERWMGDGERGLEREVEGDGERGMEREVEGDGERGMEREVEGDGERGMEREGEGGNATNFMWDSGLEAEEQNGA